MSDVAIVGGGLAGGAAAMLLARSGRRVTLLEREREPGHKICGEFLSIGAQRRLAALGLDLDRLGAAPIDTLRLVAGRRTVETRLPFVARGLTRRRLDSALLDLAAGAGAEIARGASVRSIAGKAVGTTIGELTSRTLLLANGKHDLRGAMRHRRGTEADYVGFKTYWRLAPPLRATLAGRIDVVLFRDGYAGLQLVEGEIANLCLNIRRRRLAALGGDWHGVLDAMLAEPHLAAMLGDGEPLQPKPLTIAAVPYGYRHQPAAEERAYRLGDQLAVIPSFCGDGMAMALASAFDAADAIGAEVPPARYHVLMRKRFGRQMRVAMAIQRLGQSGVVQKAMLALFARAPGIARRAVEWTRA